MSEKTLVPPKNLVNPGYFGPGVIGASEAQRPTPAQLKHDPTLADLHREDVEGGEFEKEQAWKEKTSKGAFGPGVIGPSEPQKPTAAQLLRDPTLGPLHGVKLVDGNVVPINTPDPVVAQATVAQQTEEEEVFTGGVKEPTAAQVRAHRQVPLKELKKALTESEYLFDSLVKAEFKRPDGPRKQALRILLEHAQEQETKTPPGGDVDAWPPVIARLEEALKPKEA